MQTSDFADLLGPLFGGMGMSFSFGFDNFGTGGGLPKAAFKASTNSKGRSKNKGF